MVRYGLMWDSGQTIGEDDFVYMSDAEAAAVDILLMNKNPNDYIIIREITCKEVSKISLAIEPVIKKESL